MVEPAVAFGLRRPNQPDKIWINSTFRIQLIKMGIDKAGSINELGRQLGYRSRVHPGWGVLQIMLGRQAFPFSRLKLLANYLDYPLDDILKHATQPNRVTPESTKSALAMYGLSGYIPR